MYCTLDRDTELSFLLIEEAPYDSETPSVHPRVQTPGPSGGRIGKSIGQLAREHQVHPTLIHRWRQQLRHQGDQAFPGNGRAVSDEARIAALERKVGQLTMENDLLKKVLSRLEEIPRSARGNGGSS